MHNSAVRLCNISGNYMSNARTSGSGGSLTCLYWIRSHANPVDIGGDSNFRVSVYNAIWKCL